MNKTARRSITAVLAILLIAVVAVLVAVNWMTGGNPDFAVDESTTAESSQPTQEPTQAPANPTDPVTTPASTKPDASPSDAVQTVVIDPDKWYLTLVSKKYKLPDDFTVELKDVVPTSDRQLDARCADYYTRMYNAAFTDGCTLTPYSGHRRMSTQKTNYENKIQYYVNKGYSRKDAADKAATIILPPGTSEHNLGLAMDICHTETHFEDSKEFKWLQEHAHEYGFILRYPKEKENITGIIYEPWHWRYVGEKAAKEMKASGQCLEEYLGKA